MYDLYLPLNLQTFYHEWLTEIELIICYDRGLLGKGVLKQTNWDARTLFICH